MSSIIPLLKFMTLIIMYLRNALMYHIPMINIVSGYTCASKSSVDNHDRREWVNTSLCKNPRRYYLKESVPYLGDLVLI